MKRHIACLLSLAVVLSLFLSAPPATAQETEGSEATIRGFLEKTGTQVHGFCDARMGVRTEHDDYQDDPSLGEGRLQIEMSRYVDQASLLFRGDLVYDDIERDRKDIDLERGEGFFDLREANCQFSPFAWMDAKIGRQILTWGTGDLLFICDMFPKDWPSFFTGRDQEYLKAPSDAVFVSVFSDRVNLDVAYTPRFDPDRFVSGKRLSYWNSTLGQRAGEDAMVRPDIPDDWGRDDEIALRLSRYLGDYELAVYFYNGYWKSPAGSDAVTGQAIFPDLAVYGLSARGSLGKGIGNLELGVYDSLDDKDGDDPLRNNGQFRGLVGYQRELGRKLTAGLQYYVEYMLDYGAYERALPAAGPKADHARQVATVSITKLLMNEDLKLHIFCYYSPTDCDAYLRPGASYKLTDAWLITAGANVFAGKYEHTFFNQFEHNTNLYAGARYGF